MPIITVSREPYSHGEEIADKIAKDLGYACLGSDFFKPTTRNKGAGSAPLSCAMHSGGGLDRKKDVALFRSLFFEHMLKDNVVYHGAAGHLLLRDIPNVLKVRVTADFEDRVNEFIRRTGGEYERARDEIMRQDEARRQWGGLFNSKEKEESYDLSVSLHNMNADAAAKIIVDAAKAAMREQGVNLRTLLGDLAMAARIEAALLDSFADAQAEVKHGQAFIRVEASIVQEEAASRRVKAMLAGMPGITDIYVGVIPSAYVPF